jgi:2-polyprenyl-3-methyl-5-hydroxy-6-metoxy-1,4-benzoquinol methylase
MSKLGNGANPMSSAEVLQSPNPAANEIAEELANQSGACPTCGSHEVSHFLSGPDRFHMRKEVYNLLRCSSCSMVWLDSPPKPHEMGPHYDEDYHKAIMAAGETAPAIRWRIHRNLISRYKRGGALLDVGCSSGGFLGTMKGDAWKLYGIEMEASTADKARAATGAEVIVGDVMEAPFQPESFDVITAFDLLEHVYHPRPFLAKVQEWLKPGGIFFTMLPNIDSWESRFFGNYWFGLELPRHISHFSPRSLKHVMTSLGFQEVHLATSNITYAGHSMGYVYSGALQKLGFSLTPAAKSQQKSIAWRTLRKAVRLTMVAPSGQLASLAGVGANIEGIFRKPAPGNGSVTEHQD